MRRPYTPAERLAAVTLAAEIGPKRAARHLGIPYHTVYRWTHPDYAARDRARSRATKEGYRGTCRECGASTNGSNGPGSASDLCHHCAPRMQMVWTHERVIYAIRDFAERYGRPPGVRDWQPSRAIGDYRDDLAERFYEDACWPHYGTVRDRFGSWTAAIRAAGFTPLKPGHKYTDRLSA